MQLNPSMIAVYGLLFLSVFSLWIPGASGTDRTQKRPWWPVPFGLAVILALWAGYLTMIALPTLAVLLIAVMGFGGKWGPWGRGLGGAVMILLGLGLMAHLVPGFSNPKYIEGLVLTPGAVPYHSYLNFDKTTMGLFFLAFIHTRASTAEDWKDIFKKLAPGVLLVTLIIIPASLATGYVEWEPKLVSILPVWMLVNLASTCLAEEMFFRGFIQKTLTDAWGGSRAGTICAIATASVLFGLVHYKGGAAYVALSTLAGLGYGWAYWRTGKIESAMLTHFSVNLLHILFFTYPALAT